MGFVNRHTKPSKEPFKELNSNKTKGDNRQLNHYDENTIRKIKKTQMLTKIYGNQIWWKVHEIQAPLQSYEEHDQKVQKENRRRRDSKTNPKKFWQYIVKKSIKQGVPDLISGDEYENETNTTNDKEKAEVPTDFFSSVFTEEDTRIIHNMKQRNFKEWLTIINISKEEIGKKLLELKISKAPVPDGLLPRLLQELETQIAQPLETVFQFSLAQGNVQKSGSKKRSPPPTRKETEEKRGTIDQ